MTQLVALACFACPSTMRNQISSRHLRAHGTCLGPPAYPRANGAFHAGFWFTLAPTAHPLEPLAYARANGAFTRASGVRSRQRRIYSSARGNAPGTRHAIPSLALKGRHSLCRPGQRASLVEICFKLCSRLVFGLIGRCPSTMRNQISARARPATSAARRIHAASGLTLARTPHASGLWLTLASKVHSTRASGLHSRQRRIHTSLLRTLAPTGHPRGPLAYARANGASTRASGLTLAPTAHPLISPGQRPGNPVPYTIISPERATFTMPLGGNALVWLRFALDCARALFLV